MSEREKSNKKEENKPVRKPGWNEDDEPLLVRKQKFGRITLQNTRMNEWIQSDAPVSLDEMY